MRDSLADIVHQELTQEELAAQLREAQTAAQLREKKLRRIPAAAKALKPLLTPAVRRSISRGDLRAAILTGGWADEFTPGDSIVVMAPMPNGQIAALIRDKTDVERVETAIAKLDAKLDHSRQADRRTGRTHLEQLRR